MFKKWLIFLTSSLILVPFTSEVISCSKDKTNTSNNNNTNNISNNLIDKLKSTSTLIIKSSNISNNLNDFALINTIENNLDITNYQKALISYITSENNVLIPNEITKVTFGIVQNNNETITINKNILFYNQDETILKNYKIYKIKPYTLNSKIIYYFLTSNGLYTTNDFNDFTKIDLGLEEAMIKIKSINILDDYLILGTSKGVYYSKNSSKAVKFNLKTTIDNSIVNSILVYKSIVYIGTNQALYIMNLNNNNSNEPIKIVELLNVPINNLIYQDKIYAITTEGLYISDNNIDFHKVLATSFDGNNDPNILVNNIYKTYIGNDDYLFLETNDGLYYQISKTHSDKYYFVKSFGEKNILSINKINDILYIGTNTGLYYSYDYLYNFYLDNNIKNIPVVSIDWYDQTPNLAYILTNSSINDFDNSEYGLIYLSL